MAAQFDHNAAFDTLLRDAQALRDAEADVAMRKEALVASIPRPTDPSAARRFAVAAYWAVPEIPTAILAEIGTGLQGGKATYAFTRSFTAKDSGYFCQRCGGALVVRSREQMRKVAASGWGICEDCSAPAPTKGVGAQPEPPRRNGPLDSFEKEVLELHMARNQTALVSVVWVDGGRDVEMTPTVLELYLHDPDAGAAAAAGVRKEDYLSWLDTESLVQCEATTSAGRRCRNLVPGVWADSPADWLASLERGGCCRVHGG